MGSSSRVCQTNKQWSGDETSCRGENQISFNHIAVLCCKLLDNSDITFYRLGRFAKSTTKVIVSKWKLKYTYILEGNTNVNCISTRVKPRATIREFYITATKFAISQSEAVSTVLVPCDIKSLTCDLIDIALTSCSPGRTWTR